ncbi:MAG: glycosyltransferase family 4 protein [Anaerolineales bacterium]
MKPALLFLSRWFPYPPHNGSRIRVYNLLKALRGHYRVTLIAFAEEKVRPEAMEVMQALCEQVEIIPYRPFQPQRLRALLGFFAPRPRFLVDTYRPEITQRMRTLHAQRQYALVLGSQIDMLPYLERVNGTPAVLEELEISTPYDAWRHATHPLDRMRRRLTWMKLCLYLQRVLPHLQACTSVSDVERERIQRVVPAAPPIEVVPNGVDTRHYQGDFAPPEEDALIYNGALTYQANFDAMAYFLREIYPLVRARRPKAHLRITGKTMGVPVERLPLDEGVTLTGYLEDIRPAVARAWVTVVPLRVGGGTRLKILESLALGTPVVSTSKGAEGLDLEDGKHLLIADNPQDFSAAVLRLLEDPELRARLAAQGRARVRQHYDWAQIGEQLLTGLQHVEATHAHHMA